MPVLGIVEPSEWIRRTSVRFGRRLAGTVRVDEAYRAYYHDRSEAKRAALHEALSQYLEEKGRHWEAVHRNVNSGGLMKYVHEATAPFGSGPPTATQADRLLLDARVPETRHGVLYLWENTHVETKWGTILLQGALGAAAAGLSVGGDLSGGAAGFTYGAGAASAAAGAVGAAGARPMGPPPPPGLRQIVMVQHPDWSAERVEAEVQRRKEALPVTRPAPPPTPVTTSINEQLDKPSWDMQRIRAALGTFFQSVHDKIVELVEWLWFKIVTNMETVIQLASTIIQKIVLKVLEKVAAAAVPLVGAGIDVGRGIMQAIKGVKERLGAYFKRSKFVVRPGHPTEIADAIERQMNWAIGEGVYNAAKGGASIGLTVLAAGASGGAAAVATSILDAVAAGVEFATKIILRIVEGVGIQRFIERVKEACAAKDNGDPVRPAIVHDTRRFNELFSSGCDSSACIPMMTLNSGITGDQMMFMKMFDDTTAANMVSQEQFDAATHYFDQLKQFGRSYVKATGFRFSSHKPDVHGYLYHALTHHQGGPPSLGDALLTALS
jgi:hypothetical protein